MEKYFEVFFAGKMTWEDFSSCVYDHPEDTERSAKLVGRFWVFFVKRNNTLKEGGVFWLGERPLTGHTLISIMGYYCKIKMLYGEIL